MEEDKTLNDKHDSEPPAEIPETDDSFCQIHEVKMKERNGKNGTFYSHARDLGNNNWDYCSSTGWKSERKT